MKIISSYFVYDIVLMCKVHKNPENLAIWLFGHQQSMILHFQSKKKDKCFVETITL